MKSAKRKQKGLWKPEHIQREKLRHQRLLLEQLRLPPGCCLMRSAQRTVTMRNCSRTRELQLSSSSSIIFSHQQIHEPLTIYFNLSYLHLFSPLGNEVVCRNTAVAEDPVSSETRFVSYEVVRLHYNGFIQLQTVKHLWLFQRPLPLCGVEGYWKSPPEGPEVPSNQSHSVVFSLFIDQRMALPKVTPGFGFRIVAF